MRRRWLTLLGVLALGVLAGAAVAGRPTVPPHDVRIPSVPATTAASTHTTAPESPSTSDRPAPTIDPSAPPITAVAAPPSASSVLPSTTSPATTVLPSTTSRVDPRGSIRILVANAVRRPNAAKRVADLLFGLGYRQPLITNATSTSARSTIYTRAGFEAGARLVASDLGLGPERVQPLPAGPISGRDADADVIVVLGGDWTR